MMIYGLATDLIFWYGVFTPYWYSFIAGCPSSKNGSLSGSFASPKYPNNYPDNERCTWGITVPSGYRIKVEFLEFYTEAGYDFLKIRDGTSSLSTEIATVTGQYSLGPVYFSSGTSMWFEFSSDSSNTRRGFHANYTAIHGAGMWTDLIKKVSCHGERIARKHLESRGVPGGNILIRPSSLWTPPEDTIMITSKTLISHEIKNSEATFSAVDLGTVSGWFSKRGFNPDIYLSMPEQPGKIWLYIKCGLWTVMYWLWACIPGGSQIHIQHVNK